MLVDVGSALSLPRRASELICPPQDACGSQSSTSPTEVPEVMEALSAKFDGSTSVGTVSVDSSVSPPWLSEKSSR